jgi:transcriptional regulator of acetoin/glycerol metabolism
MVSSLLSSVLAPLKTPNAAEHLGVNRKTLYNQIKKYEILQ